MKLSPLDATFGATVTDIDLRNLTDEQFKALYDAWLEYALLIFPGQHLDKESQVAFARRFGELEFDIAPISNVKKDGSLRDDDDVVKILKGNMGWHADSTYMPVQAKGAVFSAHVVPTSGGETAWADMRAAFDALPAERQQALAQLDASHSLHYSQSRLGHQHAEGSEYSGYGFHNEAPPRRPLVKTHPETGRKSLLIGRHAYDVSNLGSEESRRLLDELEAFACQPPRIYTHKWQPGEVVVWDNRCLLHRACPWDMNEARVMYHSRIKGDPITESAPVEANLQRS